MQGFQSLKISNFKGVLGGYLLSKQDFRKAGSEKFTGPFQKMGRSMGGGGGTGNFSFVNGGWLVYGQVSLLQEA